MAQAGANAVPPMIAAWERSVSQLRWWLLARTHSSFVSFSRPLRQLCQCLAPPLVLEFGPGYSTSIFLRHTNAEIQSFETDLHWYERYRRLFASPRLCLFYRENGWSLKELRAHRRAYSLVFIDGGDRMKELVECYDLIDVDGVVFLHDAHREEFEQGIRMYPFIYFAEFHSCILAKSERVYNLVKGCVSQDFTHPSVYVSSRERRRYLAQFLS